MSDYDKTKEPAIDGQKLEDLDVPYAGYTPLEGVVDPVKYPDFTKSKKNGKCVVEANRPIIPIPLTQEIKKKQVLIECDQVLVTDKVIPRVYTQDVYHEVPELHVKIKSNKVQVPFSKIVEVEKDIEVPVEIEFKVEKVSIDRMVPRLFPKFCGKQDIITVSLPVVKIVDVVETKEVVVYVGEEHVKKEIVKERGHEKIKYKYTLREVDVPVYKYRPIFDVDLVIPSPILVPIEVEPHEVDAGTSVMSWEEYRKMVKKNKRVKNRAIEELEPSEPPKAVY